MLFLNNKTLHISLHLFFFTLGFRVQQGSDRNACERRRRRCFRYDGNWIIVGDGNCVSFGLTAFGDGGCVSVKAMC